MRGGFLKGMPRHSAHLLCVGVTAILGVVSTGGPARADDPPSCSSSTAPYSPALTSLTGPQGAQLTIRVAAAPGCAAVEILKKAQVKAFSLDGELGEVRNLDDVAAPGGVVQMELGRLQRGQLVDAMVLVQPDVAGRTYVVRGEATTRLRPDLVVTAVHAPLQTLTTRPIDV